MKTVAAAKKQMGMYSKKEGIIFSYETNKGLSYGFCLISSPLYQYITTGKNRLGFGCYKNPKIIEGVSND